MLVSIPLPLAKPPLPSSVTINKPIKPEPIVEKVAPVVIAPVVIEPVVVAPVVKPAPEQLGTCNDWMDAAGIVDQASAYTLIIRESGCNPNSVNKSSGACGIGQQLPCGKWSHVWNEPIGAMIDMEGYVFASYGSWANALQHSYNFNWY